MGITMRTQNIIIEFPDLRTGEGTKKSLELKFLLEEQAVAQGIEKILDVKEVKNNPLTQDFGASLLLILGTPAAITVAKAVYNFISKYGDHLIIKTEGGTVIARGSAASNIDVAKTCAALSATAEAALGKP
jgi:hypothetical protein